ncbi:MULTISPECIES: DUF3313 domain-containing protein [unclassified Dyella]|uniref:DUF3313 domain-containing protein n=1 Tax=unclassified Dyella TaxID=2634549 RepID=UPI000C85126B|nr:MULTISPECIES: DUF3313 domain-containing protein [unclassified Dyella]MDR3446731.1 DUF3313 domain-containing protein [Dyella sp.]PMQ03233.1 hypothetical protein DyAD56_21150 [Dyella sp. AD56]
MRITYKATCFFFIGASVALAGCASTQPKPYAGIDSSSYLRPNDQARRGHEPYAYSTNVDWKHYDSFIMDPVAIYRGSDNQFDAKITEQDRQELASYMQQQFQDKLRQRYALVSTPTSGTLRIRATLTGAKGTTAFLSTFTRMDVGGTPINAVQAIRGREGLMTGSVSYAVEVYDASTGRLLKAYVDKQYPNAMNMKATFGKLGASRRGIDKGADDLLAGLQ